MPNPDPMQTSGKVSAQLRFGPISWNKLCIFFSMGCTDRYKLCSGKCVENKELPCAQHPNVWDSGICTPTVSHHTGQIRGIILSREVTHHHEGGAREELE